MFEIGRKENDTGRVSVCRKECVVWCENRRRAELESAATVGGRNTRIGCSRLKTVKSLLQNEILCILFFIYFTICDQLN